MKAICSVPECATPVMAKGWCARHYYKLRPAPECRAEGCEKPFTIKGFCAQHYARFKRYGDPLAGRIERGETQRWIADNAQHEGEACLIWPFARASHGYAVTTMDGSYALAHRVLCEARHGPAPTPAHEAAHSCGRGHEGCVNPNHLRWATVSENAQDRGEHGTQKGLLPGEAHKMAKLTDDDVLSIRRRSGEGVSNADLSRDYGVAQSNISRIVNRRSWVHLG